jgi:hypothetical protein
MENSFRGRDNANSKYDPLTAIPEGLQPRYRIVNPHVEKVTKPMVGGFYQEEVEVRSKFYQSYTLEDAEKTVQEVNAAKGLKGILPWNRAHIVPDCL